MAVILRTKSPRSPSFSLDEAIDRAFRIYEKETRHPVPADVIAQDMGYKSANNGAALSAIASLRYYGLLDRLDEGKLSVSKELETYKFAPDESIRQSLLVKWLLNPPVFFELLDKFKGGLPSDATLKFELIQKGFKPPAADSCVAIFRRSTDFAKYFENSVPVEAAVEVESARTERLAEVGVEAAGSIRQRIYEDTDVDVDDRQLDKIPVRLAGGRRAWVIVPTPLFEADKDRLIAQIGLLLTDDEDDLEQFK